MQRKAFTLIELIAVMIVIVILAYALIPRIGNMRAQAVRAYDEQTAITLANAIETTLTDGTLKTNNAPHEWSIVNYSNSPVSQMPYIQSPVLNSAIDMNMTNWPGYLITITNHDGSLYYYTGTGIPENGGTNLVAGSSGTGGSSGGAGIGGTAGAGGGASGSGGSGGSGGNNMYTLTYLTDGNGTISGSSSQTLSAGGTGTTVTAQPNSGYIFVGWSDSYPTSTRTDSNVQANLTVTASFAVVNTVDCAQNDSIASGPIYDLFQNNYVQARFPTFNPATTLPPDVNHQIDILEGGVFNPNISDGVLNEWVYRKYPFQYPENQWYGVFPYLNDDGSTPSSSNDPQGLFAGGYVNWTSPILPLPAASEIENAINTSGYLPSGSTATVTDNGNGNYQYSITDGSGNVCGPYYLGPPQGS